MEFELNNQAATPNGTDLTSEKIPAPELRRARIVLVGPTNVGKSTLFNKLTRTRKAIVADRPGVTVDAHSLTMQDDAFGELEIIDTGGVGSAIEGHPLQKEINQAAEEAVLKADVILSLSDGTRDPTSEDFEVATWLRRLDPKGVIWSVVNKADSSKFDLNTYVMMGFEKTLGVSAEHGNGIEMLWESLGEHWKTQLDPRVKVEQGFERVVVIGRPNTGKSTLLNAILGEERHVTSPVAGTTRDPVESDFHAKGVHWKLCDTAGLRRAGRLERDVEWVAKEKLKDKLRDGQLAIVVLDASEAITDQDAAIVGMAEDFGLSVIIVLNKWDMLKGEDGEDQQNKLEREQSMKLRAFEWIPVLRTSALNGKGVSQLLKTVEQVNQARNTRAGTGELNRLFERKIRPHVHPLVNGKSPKFFYLSQVSVSPPEFVVFASLSGPQVHYSYKRFIVNHLRKEFGFQGTPVKLHFKKTRH